VPAPDPATPRRAPARSGAVTVAVAAAGESLFRAIRNTQRGNKTEKKREALTEETEGGKFIINNNSKKRTFKFASRGSLNFGLSFE